MSERVAVVDYGAGNLRSAAKALLAAGAGEVEITADADRVASADRIVLPGVGAFAHCIGALRGADGIEEAMRAAVLDGGRPFLGICVGMQLLATEGHEHGVHAGLGWLPGIVRRLTPGDPTLKIPHMGWNRVEPVAGVHGTPPPPGDAYFVHSYRFDPDDRSAVLAETDHGGRFPAVVGAGNLLGVQFHPEKSQAFGLAVLRALAGVAAMIVFPAIDLKNGQCVRLAEGDMARATVYADDPAEQARAFAAAGATHLHVVDLDGSFAGESRNGAGVAAAVEAFSGRVQVGGGVRTLADVQRWLGLGVWRVVMGTAALENPELVRAAAAAHPGRIVVAVDARDGFVATRGWAERSTVAVADLAARFADAGVAALLFTDVGRDGMLRGVNLAATLALAAVSPVPVIASGGVAGVADIEALAGQANIEGVITGRALYDGRLDLAEALRLAA